jgi:hypothetical protein
VLVTTKLIDEGAENYCLHVYCCENLKILQDEKGAEMLHLMPQTKQKLGNSGYILAYTVYS